jgi:UPF0755 protein
MARASSRSWGRIVALALVLAGSLYVAQFVYGWYGAGPLAKQATFVVPNGSTLASIAGKLEAEGLIASAPAFKTRARLLGGDGGIKAGEFTVPARTSGAELLRILQGSEGFKRRLVTIPEGMPSILVSERLAAQSALTGTAPVPAEGSVLPESYDIGLGESRAAVIARMQRAMSETVAELWPKRSPDTVARTPKEAVILASIVEKETGKPSERKMVAGLYSNRLRRAMLLQADPTIIYPITRGKPLGRRIRQSEIQAVNDYNTYTMVGLPKAPITNPGRASIEAVLHPAHTDALYMVADGTGGHVFAATLPEHNANVAKWFALRRARGEI